MKINQKSFLRLFNLDVLLGAVNVILIATFFTSFGVSNIDAQRKKTKKTSPIPIVRREMIESLATVCVPPKSDFIAVVQIDKNSNVTLTIQTKNGSQQPFDKVLSNINRKPVITIKPDASLDFGSVAKILSETRRITNDCVNIEASTNSENSYIYYFPEPSPDIMVKPNPLTLIVSIMQDKKIMLNNENQGTLDDMSSFTNITKRLKGVFQDRTNNGVLREGTNEVEKSVSIKASRSVKFGDIIKVVDAIKESGALPIGLIIDDLQP